MRFRSSGQGASTPKNVEATAGSNPNAIAGCEPTANQQAATGRVGIRTRVRRLLGYGKAARCQQPCVPSDRPMDQWGPEEVVAWFDSLVPAMQRYRSQLVPEEGYVVVLWTHAYLTRKGLDDDDATRLICYRDKALARAGDPAMSKAASLRRRAADAKNADAPGAAMAPPPSDARASNGAPSSGASTSSGLGGTAELSPVSSPDGALPSKEQSGGGSGVAAAAAATGTGREASGAPLRRGGGGSAVGGDSG